MRWVRITAVLFFMIGASSLLYAFSPVTPFIVDTHEHIESLKQADALLRANRRLGIKQTILLPSPDETLTLNGKKSFTKYRENMDQILEITRRHPDSFIPFCTVNPLDADALEYFKSCLDRGGRGLKLYNGHSYYHAIFDQPLDSFAMEPIYALAEERRIPVLFHVNISKYETELQSVLDRHPHLVVSLPHFMVSSTNLPLVSALLDRYPQLFTDVSFGSPEFMAAGFRRISTHIQEFRDFFNRYPDRILFGADIVITRAGHKDDRYIADILKCYRDLLEHSSFRCDPVSDFYKKEAGKYKPDQKKYALYAGYIKDAERMSGLNLPSAALDAIYSKNPQRFFSSGL